jgi:hypothetical protein
MYKRILLCPASFLCFNFWQDKLHSVDVILRAGAVTHQWQLFMETDIVGLLVSQYHHATTALLIRSEPGACG